MLKPAVKQVLLAKKSRQGSDTSCTLEVNTPTPIQVRGNGAFILRIERRDPTTGGWPQVDETTERDYLIHTFGSHRVTLDVADRAHLGVVALEAQ